MIDIRSRPLALPSCRPGSWPGGFRGPDRAGKGTPGNEDPPPEPPVCYLPIGQGVVDRAPADPQVPAGFFRREPIGQVLPARCPVDLHWLHPRAYTRYSRVLSV